ncbi:hypothetical protein ACVFI8_13900 [Agarivorans sp. MS3-6]
MKRQKRLKRTSSKDTGKQKVRELRQWLASNPMIPTYQGQPNQTAIGRQLGITRSTWSSNPELQIIWSEIKKSFSKESAPADHCAERSSKEKDRQQMQELIVENQQVKQELLLTKAKLEMLEQDAAALEWLTLTGRYIPRLPPNYSDE